MGRKFGLGVLTRRENRGRHMANEDNTNDKGTFDCETCDRMSVRLSMKAYCPLGGGGMQMERNDEPCIGS